METPKSSTVVFKANDNAGFAWGRGFGGVIVGSGYKVTVESVTRQPNSVVSLNDTHQTKLRAN